MTYASNPGFLAVAFIEGSAAFIILILYWLLIPGFPARFFRYWLAGWTAYVCLEGLRVYSLWSGGSDEPHFSSALSLVAAALFLAAVLDCLGKARPLKYLLLASAGVIAASGGLIALVSGCGICLERREGRKLWSSAFFIFQQAGFSGGRTRDTGESDGSPKLAAGLLLRGLHGLDPSNWANHSVGLFQVTFQGLFGIMMGIAMAVLVLEAGRARTEDLNEKLRRLALITVEATQSLRVDDALQGVLRHLVESLGASHGLVFLFDDPSQPKGLTVRASVGFSDRFRKLTARVSPDEPWVRQVVLQEEPFASYHPAEDPTIRKWMDAERLSAIVLVRVPGKEGPLGLLLRDSSSVPRAFEARKKSIISSTWPISLG